MIDSDKGSKARSLEGHAAVSMKRTGPDDLRWVEIQTTTFKNWVNEQLPDELDVTDMQTDFADGTKLIALVEALQSKLIRRVRSRNPQNQHQCLENLSIALDAIQRDKIKLVNIGAEDIAENNSKLILGLIWHLILRYQIGKTSYNPKNMMLIWLQNALPKCNIKNFSTSWNDGVALHALIDFCRPGSCPNWEKLDPKNSLENCRNAMNMGKEEFDIPLVVRPEDLASPHLDELSGMTYLSYYMKEHSPGYETTLNRVRRSLIKTDVTNFTTDWNDGQAVCELVEAAGGDVPNSSGTHEEILTKGLNASKVINIQPTLTAKQMAEEKEEHLGIMAYAVKFLGRVPESHNMSLTALLNNVHTEQKTQCSLELLDPSVEPSDVSIEVMGPTSRVPVNTEWKGKTAEIEFRPVEKGTHQLRVSHKGDIVGDCCKEFDVNSNKSNISYTEIDSCPNETLTEIKVKAHSARSGQIKVVTKSPTGKEYRPEMITKDGVHTAEFIPNEVGKWNVSILHVEEHIASSPFSVDVFDPSKVKIVGLEGGTLGKELSFKADFREAGEGNFSCVIYHESQQIPVKVDPLERGLAEVKFLPNGAGIYKIHGQFRNVDIKGSPYTLEIVDSDMVSVSGAGLELVPVNQAASFNIITKDAGGGEVKVNITSPSKTKVPISLKNPEAGVHAANFTPKHIGDYVVHVTDKKGFDVRGSPFFFKAYDIRKVIVSNMPKEGSPDELIEFTIDASKAGDGNLDITVNGKRDDCNMKNLGNQKFSARLKPVDNKPQVIEMSFNHEKVEGSPWTVNMVSASSFALQEPLSKLIHIKERVQCAYTGPETHLSEIVAKVHDNRNCEVHNKIKKKSGKCEIEFVPSTVGTHKVNATFKGKDIQGSPQIIKVYDPSGIEVSDIPTEAVVGKKKKFTLDVSKSGDGRLKIKLNKGELENTVSEISSNFYGVSFVPQKPGPLEIDLTFNDRPIKDSPYMCCVKDESKQVEVIDLAKKVSCNTVSTFKIHFKGKSDPDDKIDVKVTSPSGDTIPTQLTGSTESGYQLEYTPTQVGLHEVSIAVNGEPIKDSPFQVQTYDASLVKVSQIPQGIVGVPCKLTVDTGSAGEGTLKAELFAEGVPVPCHVNDVTPTQCEVTLLGQQAVRHQLYLTFNSHNVSGIPYVIDYLDPGDIAASGEGLDMVCCQHTALFTVDTKGGSLSDLAVSITAPDGKEVPVKLKNKGDHTYQVEWTPLVIGDHKISICYANTPLRNSPFTAKVFDASLVTVQPATKGNLGKPVEFTVDTSEAGVGTTEICVKVNGDNVPNYVKQKEIDTHLNVSFTPQEPSKHLVHIRFNGNPVPGSPFPVRILNSDHIHVSGEALQLAPANTLASFKIDPKGADDGDVDIIITAPNGKTIPARLSGSPSSVYQVDFTPSQIGKHTIKVCCDDTEIKGSPFYCNVFDANLATVKGPARAYLNHSVTILVDVSKAGDGHLEAEAKCNGSLVRSNIQDLGSGCYEVTYTPRDTDTHMVTLLFNGYPLPGSPLRMNILDSRSVSATGDGLKVAQVHRTTGFDISAPGGDEDLDIIITRPSGSELPFSKTERGHNCHIEFSPREVGRYTIEAMMAGTPINGSPFYCNVYDPSLVRITNLDRAGKIKKDIFYTVDTSKSGEGDLKTSVTHHGRPIQTQREQLPDGNSRFFFIPEQAGQYEVAVQFNNEEIPGSPVIVTVESDVPKSITINFGGIEQINAKTSNWFHIELNGEMIDMNLLQILIRAPNGSLIPTKLVPQSNGDYTVEWYPVVGGQHIIDVLYDNKKVHNSPFTVEALDVNSIIVTDTYNSIINKPAGMTIDTYGAGKASNVITVLDPNGKSVPYETKEKDTKKEIAYIPKIAGEYQIYINFGGLELPGSPIIQKVGDGITPRVHGDGLYKGFKDEPTVFTVDSAQMRGDLFVQVDGPKSIAKCNVNPEEDGAYTVTYIPVEVGQYNINAKWDGQLIQGCPFHPKIYDIQKVRVVGGWQTYMDANNRIPLVINEKKKITFDVSEAGPGKLSAVVTDPHQNNVPVHLESSSPGIVALSFTPKVDGNYCINISWADRQLFGAPFIGSVASKAGQKFDSALVVLSGPGVRKAVVGQEAEFHIDGSKAPPGKPEVNVTGVRTEIPTYLISQGNQCYQCKYTPVFPGAYHLNIKWSGKQLMGCPYKITAITAPQPKNVTVTGDGLKGGMLGKDLQMDIDTRKAGLGELTAQCVGPHKNAYCELVDKHHGVYRLTVQPQEIGRHVLQIKFAGEDVLGSPYVLNIGTYPDASKVRVSGPGVEHGILATYESRFLVETKGAGAGQLSVRIKGPKGAFHVEMSRDSQKDRNITCCYNPYETGIYLIQVKWSGVDVPGSPFEVHIVDTHHEYEAIVRDMANHSNGYLDSPKQRHSAYDYLR